MIVDFKAKQPIFYTRDETVTAYYNDVRHYELLSAEKEKELLYLLHNGTEQQKKKARDTLVLSNQRFVIAMAKRFADNNNLIDLIGEANVGLLNAIDTFDPSKQIRLLTYAVFWIRKYINLYLAETEKIVKPINAHIVYSYVEKARERFNSENCRYPTDNELIEYLKDKYNVKLSNKEDVAEFSVKSIDDNINASNDTEYGDCSFFTQKTASNNIAEEIETKDKKTIVNELLSELDYKERMIIVHTFGIGCENKSLKEIAEMLNMTTEGVRTIYKKAKNKLSKVDIENL